MAVAEKIPAAISRHVDELWPGRANLQDLLGAGQAVELAMESSGYQAIKAVLEAEIASIDRQLDGPAPDEREYRRLHGRRSALTAFEDAAMAIVARANERRRIAEEDAQREATGESVAGR